jgi:hypothetical protein
MAWLSLPKPLFTPGLLGGGIVPLRSYTRTGGTPGAGAAQGKTTPKRRALLVQCYEAAHPLA